MPSSFSVVPIQSMSETLSASLDLQARFLPRSSGTSLACWPPAIEWSVKDVPLAVVVVMVELTDHRTAPGEL